MSTKSFTFAGACVGAMLLLTACGETVQQRAATGGLSGVAAGALVGGPVGAVVGGAAGAGTGAVMDEGLDQKAREMSANP
jgi:hypothetical protein